MKKVIPFLVLIPFFAYSFVVAYGHGALGFITLAMKEPWGMQMLLDLSISLFLVGGWLRRDARAHGINPIPYIVMLVLLGSIGALVYLVRRNFFSTSTSPTSLLATDGRRISGNEATHGRAA
jgi:hypothetical protein